MTSTRQSKRISSDFLLDFPHYHGVISFYKKDIIESYPLCPNHEQRWNHLIETFRSEGQDILCITEDRVFIGVDMGSGFKYLTAYFDEIVNELFEKKLIDESYED